MSRHPEIKWAQREDKVFITVLLPDAKEAKVNLAPEGIFTFSASAGSEKHQFELKLELFDKVNVEESKINIGERSVFCILEKAEPKWWNKLLCGDAKTPHYVKVDWDKWVDEDDDAAPADPDMGGMDFSKFGDMGGMGGMPGMGMGGMPGMGMGGMPGMGMGGMPGMGMGGMPGMGMGGMPGMGMGGMPGMGMGGMPDMGDFSMGDDLEDSDDEDKEVAKPEGEAKTEQHASSKPAGASEGKAEAAPSM